ncbi:MAG: pyridoxine 5'-phosphate synthase [Thermoguttaceae bacterium]
MIELGVNIDHIATVREARKTNEPDPVWAAAMAELGGADGITVHLREDRRHIQDRDVKILRETVRCKLNLEMALDPSITAFACSLRPDQATLVPERREEVTTEGGLNAVAHRSEIVRVAGALRENGISVSLFLDPDPAAIEVAIGLETVDAVELHTGCYANAKTSAARDNELQRLRAASAMIVSAGKRLHAGHGLTYHNVLPIAHIPQMLELNIGHSIVARALMVGMTAAVREMRELLGL